MSGQQTLYEGEESAADDHRYQMWNKLSYRYPPPQYELYNFAQPEHIYNDLRCGQLELQSVRSDDLHELSFHKFSPNGDRLRRGFDSRKMSGSIAAPNDNGEPMHLTKQFGRKKSPLIMRLVRLSYYI